MDLLRRNYKAIAGALVGVLSVLVPAYVTTGMITPDVWGFAVAALIGGHQVVYATAANKVSVEAALGVVLPVLSKRSPYVAESLKAAINAVPEYVPTTVPKPSPVPRDPTPSTSASTGTYPDGPYVPPVSEPVGATAAPPVP